MKRRSALEYYFPKKAASIYLDESYSEWDAETTQNQLDDIISKRRGFRDCFTVFEDATLLEAVQDKQFMYRNICSDLSINFYWSRRSLYDRCRHYLLNISEKDKQLIIQHAKQFPNHYVHFSKPVNGQREIKYIVKEAPQIQSLQNMDTFEKEKRKQKEITEHLNILEISLQSPDPTIQNSQGVIILMAINKVLVENNICSQKQIQKLLEKSHKDSNLMEYLSKLINK